MSADPQVELGKRLCDYIASGNYSQEFTVERSYADWDLPLADDAGEELRVDVVPVNKPESELEDRGSVAYHQAFDVVVRKKFKQEAADHDNSARVAIEEVDALVPIVFELHEWMIGERMPGEDLDATWERTDIESTCVHKLLRDCRQYTGRIRVLYSVVRKLPA